MKKPILVFVIILNLVLKTLWLEAPTVCWSNLFHLLITLLEKSASKQSRVHLIFANLSECPLVSLVFSSNINNSWSLTKNLSTKLASHFTIHISARVDQSHVSIRPHRIIVFFSGATPRVNIASHNPASRRSLSRQLLHTAAGTIKSK